MRGSRRRSSTSRTRPRGSELRIARLHANVAGAGVRSRLDACSPEAAGFVAAFSRLEIEPAERLW